MNVKEWTKGFLLDFGLDKRTMDSISPLVQVPIKTIIALLISIFFRLIKDK